MPVPKPTLDFQITLPAWRKIPGLRRRLQKAAQITLSHLPNKLRLPIKATILLTGNAKVRQLNCDFRGIDKATNVLSFPQFEPFQLPTAGQQKTLVELGDIALAYQYVVVEAKQEHKILINHIVHLVIHGLLHLFGYDHAHEYEATKMEKLEVQIMKAIGLPDPYAPAPTQNKTRKRKSI